MALQDIITTLTAEAEAEIAEIARSRDAEIANISAQLAAYTKTRTEEAAADRARRAEKVAERILAKARHQATFITTGGAEADVEAVFQAMETLLCDLPDANYRVFLSTKWNSLPANAATMSFKIAAERAEATEAMLRSHNVPSTAITPAAGLLGGFVAITDTLEIDCSFSGILKQLRQTDTILISQQLTQK